MDRIPHSQGSPIGAACIPAEGGCPATCSPPAPCHIEGLQLVVAPFRVLRRRQAYLSRSEIRIDLAAILPGTYRVLAVHNFHVEDCNPCLDECLAGVFLAARRADGGWEEPERFPVECREVSVLATLTVDVGAVAELRP